MTNCTIVNLSSLEGGEIDRDRIVDEDLVSEEYFCPVCQYLLWKPRACSSCRHVFCEKCIQTWLDNPISRNKCPFRCEPFQDSPCPTYIQAALLRLDIRCRNASFGCSHIVSYDQLEYHENVQCQFLTKRCVECEQLVLVSKYDEHRRIEGLCHPCPIKCTICQNYFEKAFFRAHFHQCCSNKIEQSMIRAFTYPNRQTADLNQTAEPNFILIFLQTIANITLLFQQQKQMSRLPSIFKGLDAIQRAREQNHGYLYHTGVMIKFFLLNWTHFPFFMFNYLIGIVFHGGLLGLGSYILICRWSCKSFQRGFFSLIFFGWLSIYGTRFICRSFSDLTIIWFAEILRFLFVCATDRGPLEALEISPLFNKKKLCVVLYCLSLLLMKVILLMIRFYYWLIPTWFAAVLFIGVNWYLALKIYRNSNNDTTSVAAPTTTPANRLTMPV